MTRSFRDAYTRLMNRLFFGLLCLGLCQTLPAAEFSPALERELEAAGSRDFISAIVILESPVDIRALDFALHARRATLAERHKDVITALQYNAEQTQPAFLKELAEAMNAGRVEGFTPYWIENCVVVYAEKAYLESLRDRGGITFFTENFRPELIAPISIEMQVGRDLRPLRHNALDSETTTADQDAIGTTRVHRELGITGHGVLVANCDTGVDVAHPALGARWRGNFAPAAECWRDAAGLGHATPIDAHGHGTHVMGTIAGRAIDGGDTTTMGGAPDALWIATNSVQQGVGSSFDNDILADYQWFADPDGDLSTLDDVPDVIQNSWGVSTDLGYAQCFGYWNTAILNCEAAGPVVTWSAGNEDVNGLRSPAIFSINAYQVFSVGAVDASDGAAPFPVADFSSRGPTPCFPYFPDNIKPEISAPGVDIYSCYPGGGYATMSGTSMAGPHVAGVVALMREACPDCDHIAVKEALMQTALDQGDPGPDNEYGWGVINAYDAVAAVSTLGHLVGQVTDGTDALLGVAVRLSSSSNRALTDVSGNYDLALPPGSYDVEYALEGYGVVTRTGIFVTEQATTTLNVVMPELSVVTFVDEDFEGGAEGWTHDSPAGWVDDWHISTERALSGTQSYKCGDTGTGTYANLCDARLISPVFADLPASASLSFVTQIESELSGAYPDSAYDGGLVELSVNGGTFTLVNPTPDYNKRFRFLRGSGLPYNGPVAGAPCLAGSITTWTTYSVDLSAYADQSVQFRFRFGSDAGTGREGWYVDDILGLGFGSPISAPPTELTILVNTTAGTLEFSWVGQAPMYEVFSSFSPDGPFDTPVASTTNPSLSIPIPDGSTCYYQVVSVNGAAVSVPSAVVTPVIR